MTWWNRNKRVLNNQFLQELNGDILSLMEAADKELTQAEEEAKTSAAGGKALAKSVYQKKIKGIHETLFLSIASLKSAHVTRVEANLQAQK